MKLFKAKVIENRQLIKGHFILTLYPESKIKQPKPGNFFMVSVYDGLDPLLKRPISIHRLLGTDFQLLYRVAGKGTKILSEKKPGDKLEVLGPIGNGFPVKKTPRKTILVAGGIGIAPIFALAESLVNSKHKDVPLLYYGARTKNEVLCIDKLNALGIEPIIATDDGSLGKKGNIINVLKRHLTRDASLAASHEIFSCGPGPMLKALSEVAVKNSIECHVALEQNMACGVGTCLGCIVNTTKGQKRVCKEGPVFPARDIVW